MADRSSDSGEEPEPESNSGSPIDMNVLNSYMKKFMETSASNARALDKLNKRCDALQSKNVASASNQIKCVVVKAPEKRKCVENFPPAKKTKSSKVSNPGPSSSGIQSAFNQGNTRSQRKVPVPNSELVAEPNFEPLSKSITRSQRKLPSHGVVEAEPNFILNNISVSQGEAPNQGGLDIEPDVFNEEFADNYSPSVDDSQFQEEDESDKLLADYLLSESSEQGEDSDDLGGIPVIGPKQQFNWVPPKNSFKWFQNIADTELSEDQLEDFMSRFVSPTDTECHFEPPKLPNVIWSKLTAGGGKSDEYFKQRSIFKSQKLLSSTMKPLLSVLNSLKPSDPNQEILASAIQVLCTTNLQMSRLRRTAISKFVKSDMRQPLFAQPVSHLHLFGSDIDSSADKAVKNLSSFQKMLYVPKKKSYPSSTSPIQPHGSAISSNPGPSTSRSGPAQRSTQPYTPRASVIQRLQPRRPARSEPSQDAQEPPQPSQPFRNRGRGRYPRRSRGGRWSY